MSLKQIAIARERYHAAQDALVKLIERTFSPGDTVTIERGGHHYMTEVAEPWPESDPGKCVSHDDVWILGRNGKPYRCAAYFVTKHRKRNTRPQGNVSTSTMEG